MIYEYSDLAEDNKEQEMTDCPVCGSDKTTYLNYINGKGELRRCHDCDNEFIIEEELIMKLTEVEKTVLKHSLRRHFDDAGMQREIISIAKKLDVDCEFIDELESDYKFELNKIN